jgi:hypothetical protein
MRRGLVMMRSDVGENEAYGLLGAAAERTGMALAVGRDLYVETGQITAG